MLADEDNDEENDETPVSAPTPHGLTMSDEKYRIYLEERKQLIKVAFESSKAFDKSILTLAAGAFAFSVAILKDVIPDRVPWTTWMLIFSWVFFAMAIITILVSFMTSRWACEQQIEDVWRYLVEGEERSSNKWSDWTERLNIASIVSVVLAIILFGIFTFVNLTQPKEGTLTERKDHGVVPPKPPATRESAPAAPSTPTDPGQRGYRPAPPPARPPATPQPKPKQ